MESKGLLTSPCGKCFLPDGIVQNIELGLLSQVNVGFLGCKGVCYYFQGPVNRSGWNRSGCLPVACGRRDRFPFWDTITLRRIQNNYLRGDCYWEARFSRQCFRIPPLSPHSSSAPVPPPSLDIFHLCKVCTLYHGKCDEHHSSRRTEVRCYHPSKPLSANLDVCPNVPKLMNLLVDWPWSRLSWSAFCSMRSSPMTLNFAPI